MSRVHLGCGLDILPGWVNVDIAPNLPGQYNVWNLDEIPWPFCGDSEADEIRARDIFEHVEDPVGFMTECHRILKPGAWLRMQTTYWQWVDAFTDPTHKRFPTEQTFDFWVKGTVLYEAQNAQMGGVEFIKKRVQPNPNTGQMDVWLVKPGA